MKTKRKVHDIEEDLARYCAARSEAVQRLERHNRLAETCLETVHQTLVLVYRSAVADLNRHIRALEKENASAKARENNALPARKGY